MTGYHRLGCLLLLMIAELAIGNSLKTSCKDVAPCSMTLIETIPDVLTYPPGSPRHDNISTHWRRLIRSAKTSIDILSFYWALKGSDVKGGPYKQAVIGEQVFADIKAAADRGVAIRVIQNRESNNTRELSQYKNVQVRNIDMKRLLNAGIIHTKFFAVDGKSAYVGSGNMDWRALTEVKEIGMAVYACACTVADVMKVFETNWMLAAKDSKIPSVWPMQYRTEFNKDNPIVVQQSDKPSMNVFWTASPPAFCPPKRTSELDAILDMIRTAKKYVYIAVMDYYTAFVYVRPKKYWDVIDRALREAVYNRGITVRLMTSKWKSTRKQQIVMLKSLNEFGRMPDIKDGSLTVKVFEMPKADIPYARVSHSKYIVTDNAVFVSTSNWSGDYFTSTGGLALVISESDGGNKSSMHEELRRTHIRDWMSDYAKPVDSM